MATLGTSAPMQNTINYDALLSTTFMAYRAVLVDNIFKANAFLAALRKYGGIDYQDGGERIQQPLMYEQNDTFKSYRGYEQLEVKPQDGITSAFYPWSEVGGTITISRREERQNSGEAALLNLLKGKISQAEMSCKATINSQLILGTVSSSTFVPGNSAKDLFPLGYFLPKDRTTDPTTGGSVGGINRATYSWWRPRSVYFGGSAQAYDDAGASVSTWKALQVYLYRLYNWCTRGADGSGPNLALTNQETYEAYENSLNNQKIYLDEDLVSMGFDNIKLKGAVMLWDELVPDIDSGTAALTYGSIFMLNTQFYKLIIDRETDFVTTPFVEPENQTAKTAKVLFMGNTVVSNPRKLGVGRAISLSITS
jgi:hypothetical protein